MNAALSKGSVSEAKKAREDSGKKASDKSRESRPTDAPSGTKPIDQSSLGRGKIHEIKDQIGAGPKDWVGITPQGDIITTDPLTGKAVNEGNVGSF